MAVIVDISTSLDGFISLPDDSAGPLHNWFFVGQEATGEFFHTSGRDTDVLRENLERTGATIAGRSTYDFANGWQGSHPAGAPVVVVTHNPPADPPEGSTPFFFVDGAREAVAKALELAGDKDVVVMGGASIIEQLLAEGLVDVIQLHVSPVLLGEGKRLIDALPAHVGLAPDRVIQGPHATHLRYRVR